MSAKLREMAQQATDGLTDRMVCELTGISYPSWRKWMDGQLPSEQTLLKFCSGLSLDCGPYLEERARTLNKPIGHTAILIAALDLSPLSHNQKIEIVEHYQKLLNETKHSQAA